MTREWVFYTPRGGGNPVAKEIKKARLTKHEHGRLEALMERVADGDVLPREVKDLRDGVRQFKFDVADHSYRLLYAEVDDGLMLLALHFFSKKQQNDRRAINLACKRLRDWNQRR